MPRSSPNRRSIFDPSQIERLRSILGTELLDRLLPVWEKTAPFYKEAEEQTAAEVQQRHKRARLHVSNAAKVEKRAGQLLELLKEATPLIREAHSLGFLAPELAKPRYTTLGALSLTDLPWFIQTRKVLEKLEGHAHQWGCQAETRARGSRGRKKVNEDRLVLAGWIGDQLSQAGLRLTKSADGPFATVLNVVYEAFGIAQPEDLYRDVKHAVDSVERDRKVRVLQKSDAPS